jgi:hypothetical protein
MVDPGLQWHPALYAGSAHYYAMGRNSYPTPLAEALVRALGLDGPGRVLDVGCSCALRNCRQTWADIE